MKHPEGRITARIRSDRLLGCSSPPTGAGRAGRNTPTSVEQWPEPAQSAWLRPHAAHRRRHGGLIDHFSPETLSLIDREQRKAADSKYENVRDRASPVFHVGRCAPQFPNTM